MIAACGGRSGINRSGSGPPITETRVPPRLLVRWWRGGGACCAVCLASYTGQLSSGECTLCEQWALELRAGAPRGGAPRVPAVLSREAGRGRRLEVRQVP